MSSFKDNFKRDSEEDMLDYDDSAFYYFSMAVLTFVCVPYLYMLAKTFINGTIDLRWDGVNCETSWFQKLLAKKTIDAKKSIWTRALYFRIFVGIFLSYLWYINFMMVCAIEGL